MDNIRQYQADMAVQCQKYEEDFRYNVEKRLQELRSEKITQNITSAMELMQKADALTKEINQLGILKISLKKQLKAELETISFQIDELLKEDTADKQLEEVSHKAYQTADSYKKTLQRYIESMQFAEVCPLPPVIDF